MMSRRDTSLMLMIFYEGPWERVSNLFIGLRKDGSFRWNIPAGATGWRKAAEAVADWAETRDHIWRAKYAIRRKTPHKVWKRRPD